MCNICRGERPDAQQSEGYSPVWNCRSPPEINSYLVELVIMLLSYMEFNVDPHKIRGITIIASLSSVSRTS